MTVYVNELHNNNNNNNILLSIGKLTNLKFTIYNLYYNLKL
jgi:hypothetical protein